MRGELDVLASLVHTGAAAIHGYGVVKGVLPPKLAGAVIALHVIGVSYNVRRGQYEDAGAHILGVLAANSNHRGLHGAVAFYDGAAAVQHARDAWVAK